MANLMLQERKELMKKTQRGNFDSVLNSFAMLDPTFRIHLKHESKNSKIISWKIQNEVIECLATFVCSNIKAEMSVYFAVTADKVTDRFSNSEVLLLCLRYVTLNNEKPKVCETFFNSLHIQERPSGQTIGNSILSLLQRNDSDISNCRAQAYDGANSMSSDRCGAVSVLKKEKQLAEYTHCRNYMLNLAICFACKTQSIRKFMDNLTTLCFLYENSPKKQRYFENFIEFYIEKLNLSETRLKEIIGFTKTRRVERNKAYRTYLLLFKATVFTLESICEQQLYEEFYKKFRK